MKLAIAIAIALLAFTSSADASNDFAASCIEENILTVRLNLTAMEEEIPFNKAVISAKNKTSWKMICIQGIKSISGDGDGNFATIQVATLDKPSGIWIGSITNPLQYQIF